MAGQPTSLTLLQKVRDQEPDAWRRLMYLYEPLVQNWAKYWGLTGADADDLVQEVFQAVMNSLDTFRKEAAGNSFRGWLKGVARHKLLDLRRKARRLPSAAGGTDAQIAINSVADPEVDLPDDSISDLSQLYRRVLELVREEFEPMTWQAFWRVTVDGQTTATAAAELGLSTGAVRVAKSRILHRLREEVGELVELPNT